MPPQPSSAGETRVLCSATLGLQSPHVGGSGRPCCACCASRASSNAARRDSSAALRARSSCAGVGASKKCYMLRAGHKARD